VLIKVQESLAIYRPIGNWKPTIEQFKISRICLSERRNRYQKIRITTAVNYQISRLEEVTVDW